MLLHRTCVASFAGLLLVLVGCASPRTGDTDPRPAAPSRRPNIVLLYADDAGYGDFGFQPRAVAKMRRLTPHIDAIAAAGVRCAAAYMSGPVCSPSRAGMLTGRYQSRFGHENNLPAGYLRGGLSLREKTIADRMKALGYATGLVGKWHLGYPPSYHPNRRGFDWFYGLLQGSRGYFPAKAPTPHQVIQENGKPTEESGYVTDRFGDAAVRFITEHREQPFFLFVSFTAPHGPLQPKQEDFDALTQFQQLRRRRYAGLIRSLDANVGKVLAALDALGLADHTLVVFTNDNGGQTLTGANNQPLRGRKGQLVEGGIRVPMCMRWPGRIRAGSVVEDPVISLDLLPTFVRAGGGTVDPAWRLDGVDLLPRLTGVSAALPERPLFWRFGGPGGAAAVRLGRYKLLIADRAKSSEPELYDLAADLGEARDLAGQPVHAELRGKLHGLLTGWEKELVEPSWTYGRRQDRRK